MSEKPIIFSTPMIRAILSGQKTMTRRVIKPQPSDAVGRLNGPEMYKPAIIKNGELQEGKNIYGVYDDWGDYGVKCPWKPGDILWVREKTFGNIGSLGNQDLCYATYCPCQRSDAEHAQVKGWRPSIHMPRAAARIFLKVTNVRVERLQDITEEDAKNEGVKDPYDYQHPDYYEQPHMRGLEINKSAFAGLWDNLNAKRGYGWKMNPFVWVISLEVANK